MDPVTTASEPTPAQSNPSEDFSFSAYVLCFAIAGVLYALSPGPIAKCVLYNQGTTNPSTARVAEIAYAPITFCCQRFPAVEKFYIWYMKDVWRLR
jgi:hypothetical protein